MLGDNSAMVGCGTSRREKSIGIWKVRAPKDERHKEWRENWLNEIAKTILLDAEFKKRIKEDRVLTCQQWRAGGLSSEGALL